MAAYFQTHKQRIAQWGKTRRHGAKPSGVVVVHTAESATDFSGADSGAESVARYFCNATRYASYHAICDADSSIQLVPWASEAWHDTGTNNHSVGISGAIQCKHWDELEERGERIVKRMARKAAEYAKWLKRNHGITIPARKISHDQSRNRVPGFLAHGTSDPGRRTDPGSEFDWNLFFAEYKAALRGTVIPAGNIKPSKPSKSGKPGLQHGWTPAQVNNIVNALNRMGLDAGYPDGVYGPILTAAVRAFQKAHGLVEDGIYGPVTQGVYFKNRAIQKALRSEGYTKQIVDGYYGDQTTANVKDFQRRTGLVQDGIAGPVTQKRLGL